MIDPETYWGLGDYQYTMYQINDAYPVDDVIQEFEDRNIYADEEVGKTWYIETIDDRAYLYVWGTNYLFEEVLMEVYDPM